MSLQNSDNDPSTVTDVPAGAYDVATPFHHEAEETAAPLHPDGGPVQATDPTPTEATPTTPVAVQQQGVKRSAEDANDLECTPDAADAAAVLAAKKKRLCRYPGCTRVIKSQGHCQRHGAKAKRCKVEGCDKQAQGTHDGMCKRHWKAANFPEEASKKGSTPPEPEGESVYDYIIPVSIAYRPIPLKADEAGQAQTPFASKVDIDPPAVPEGFQLMALVEYLREGVISGKPAGWHRNAERRARGMFPVKGLSVQLEPWERQLALIEILLLSGGTPYANFKDLAHAWGREKGFHQPLCQNVCERKGEVERKKRSDAGKSMTEEEKLAFRSKLQKSRDKNGTSKKSKRVDSGGEETGQEEESLPAMQEQTMEQQQNEEQAPMDVEMQQQQHEQESVEVKTESVVAVDGGPRMEEPMMAPAPSPPPLPPPPLPQPVAMEAPAGIVENMTTIDVNPPQIQTPQVQPPMHDTTENSTPTNHHIQHQTAENVTEI